MTPKLDDAFPGITAQDEEDDMEKELPPEEDDEEEELKPDDEGVEEM